MLSVFLNFLGGSVLKSAVDAYRERLAAAGTQDKLAVELATKEIEAEIEARKIAATISIAENGRWWTAAPRSIVQWSFALFVAKCVVWDNLLGLGTTDPLQGDLSSWAGMVMAMWFGGRTIEKVARIFKR